MLGASRLPKTKACHAVMPNGNMNPATRIRPSAESRLHGLKEDCTDVPQDRT